MSPHSGPSRFAQGLRQARSGLRGGHLVALSAIAVVAFGLVGLRAVDLPGPSPLTDDGRLRIEVVHPVEPDIVPGSPMDVGELVDGFKGVPPPPPPVTDRWAYDESWLEDLPPLPPPPWRRRPAAEEAGARASEPEPRAARRGGGGWFGFDAPRRDFQAERAARRARLEAMEQRARLDRLAREGWRPVPAPRETTRWRDGARDGPREEGRAQQRSDIPEPVRDEDATPYPPRDAGLPVPEPRSGAAQSPATFNPHAP
jgi:hypothetical protein